MHRPDPHRKCRRRLTIAVVGIMLSALCSVPVTADMAVIPGFQFQNNLGSIIQLDQTLMNVKIPLNISNLPGAWKHSKLKIYAMVQFLDGAGERVGYGLGEGGEAMTPIEVTLQNGSYNGTVTYPIRETAGGITANTCCSAMVFAELGDQIMILGSSTGGTASNTQGCADSSWMSNATPGTVITP